MPTFDNHPIYSWDNFLDSVYANPLLALGVSDGTAEHPARSEDPASEVSH